MDNSSIESNKLIQNAEERRKEFEAANKFNYTDKLNVKLIKSYMKIGYPYNSMHWELCQTESETDDEYDFARTNFEFREWNDDHTVTGRRSINMSVMEMLQLRNIFDTIIKDELKLPY